MLEKNRLSWLNDCRPTPRRSRRNAETKASVVDIGYRRRMPVPPVEVALSRGIIDDIDHAIIELLARRRAVVKSLFAKKQALGVPLVDPRRESELITDRCAYARSLGVSPEFVEVIFRKILDDSHSIDAGA